MIASGESAASFLVGTWLSLVEHSLGVRGVGSSNLPVPTNSSAPGSFAPLRISPAGLCFAHASSRIRLPCTSVFFLFVRPCIESHTLPLCPPRKSKIKSHTCACGPLSGLRTSSRRLRAFPSHPSCPRIPFPDCVRRLACLNHFYLMRLVPLVCLPAASAPVRGRGGCQGRYGYIHSNGAAVCWELKPVWRNRSRQKHSCQFANNL